MASTMTVLFLILLILKSILIPSFSCPVHQKHALLRFKFTLPAISISKYFVTSNPLDTWDPASDCCSWKRVTCSRTESVIELQLQNVDTSPVSPEILTPIFHIRSLELLDISSNYIKGEIPGDGFGNLTKLLHLDMSYNNLNGSIPSQLFQLTNLHLDLSDNYKLERVLSPEVGKLINLVGKLINLVGKLINLESLKLNNNGDFLGNIPEEIGNLTKLRDFSLRNNRFSSGIPSSIANLTKLESLDLSFNSLSLEIPTFIGRLTNLTFLNLRSNQLTGPIPSSMQKLSKLELLELDDNMLAGEIPTSLFKIRTLTELYRGGKGSNLIWNNTTKGDPSRCSLRRMSMHSCGISGQILEWISSQKELTYLDLSGNKLEGRFPHWLAEMNNIELIILSDNNLIGQIPPRLFISNRLSVLDLSRNNFSGELPENIGNATWISYLAVSENHFSGLIPKSISNLTLSLLDLSQNKFSGDILPIFRAVYDFSLDLSNNDLSAFTSFPQANQFGSLAWCESCVWFCFEVSWFERFVIGFKVRVRWCVIARGEADPFGSSIRIRVNLSVDSVPVCLGAFACFLYSRTTFQSTRRNNLSGSIPRQMANLPIMNMSASSDHIDRFLGDLVEDKLQDLLVNWKKSSQRLGNSGIFVLLDLSGNKISGEIPASLGNLKALKQLNISHKKISGNIALLLGNLVGIESLDVSHNELSGLIPESLDQLGNLTVLDINIKCPEDIPSSQERDEEDEDLSWIFWEGTWICFPVGFFSTILTMGYLLNFIQLFKFCIESET
ncbi:Leucine-rich repeat-containing protein [Artemisia annua]|uniref:Leucine-rich repeat-containing protein n=1 Tax=Artemisia annua TaxID=35608 RepID=A0A2U1M8J2_ARTAN|nr:Leucine-rich repeat-containing protein [Artemisia annua]